ncbi:MAG TPA: DeoR/GlpR transcriptional regulator [Rhodobacteraceae bacterium]|jgi:DeoR family glycerol-3-phosphate regulon repressor|nr:DeoR/GlpR transcriptional regulator [Paracoccaceae bacterium]HBG98343.1 DeoR/GlpR transcriptional regulator [Paracoccaceae bacterium]
MQPTQREVELLRLLGETGSGRIQALSRQLDVSEETVRRAVRRLESRGLVTKLHGGVALKGWRREPNFTQRFSENPAAKRRIAAAAAGLIPDGASLFLDVGSTTAYVAEALRGHRDLMVVTNSLFAAHSLTGLNGNRVYMAGGELRAHDGGAFGAGAVAFVGQFRVGFAVLSAAAVDARAGFLLHDLREAELSRCIIAAAEQSILVADATKFGRAAPIRLTDPAEIDRLVTDAVPPSPIGAMLRAAEVEVVLAPSDVEAGRAAALPP